MYKYRRTYIPFLRDVISSMLVSQTKTNPVGVELFPCVNIFFFPINFPQFQLKNSDLFSDDEELK